MDFQDMKEIRQLLTGIMPESWENEEGPTEENITNIIGDGLYMIAKAIDRLTAAIEKQREAK